MELEAVEVKGPDRTAGPTGWSKARAVLANDRYSEAHGPILANARVGKGAVPLFHVKQRPSIGAYSVSSGSPFVRGRSRRTLPGRPGSSVGTPSCEGMSYGERSLRGGCSRLQLPLSTRPTAQHSLGSTPLKSRCWESACFT
jgi:hypothetical protein